MVNDVVLICTCNVKSDEYNCWTKHAFVYDSYFKTLHQSKCCGDLIDNISDASICVLEDNEIETKTFEICPYRILWWYVPCVICLKNKSMLFKCYHIYIYINKYK